MAQMIDEEQLMEGFPPHPRIGSSTSAAPPFSFAALALGVADPASVKLKFTGSSSIRPASRLCKKRKPTRLLPHGEQYDLTPERTPPRFALTSKTQTKKTDVKWPRQHLNEIREAVNSNNEAMSMVVQRNECMKRVEQNIEELKRLQTQFEMTQGMGGIGKYYMINEEQLDAMERFPPHPQIQSEGSSTSDAPSHSTTAFAVGMVDPASEEIEFAGSSSMRPASRSRNKRKPTRLLPDDQQDDVEPDRIPPQFGSTAKTHIYLIVEAIKEKYGDIGKGCVLKTGFMKELNLFGICSMLRVLKKQKIDELDIGSLKPYYEVVRDAETIKIDVNWLRQRLDEIREAISSNNEAKLMVVQRNECMKKVAQNKDELKRLQTQLEKLETQMAVDSFKVKHLDKNINALTTKYKHFQRATLTDGLL